MLTEQRLELHTDAFVFQLMYSWRLTIQYSFIKMSKTQSTESWAIYFRFFFIHQNNIQFRICFYCIVIKINFAKISKQSGSMKQYGKLCIFFKEVNWSTNGLWSIHEEAA